LTGSGTNPLSNSYGFFFATELRLLVILLGPGAKQKNITILNFL
jgi:hypothetical protein